MYHAEISPEGRWVLKHDGECSDKSKEKFQAQGNGRDLVGFPQEAEWVQQMEE
jgi:hypothetical protein